MGLAAAGCQAHRKKDASRRSGEESGCTCAVSFSMIEYLYLSRCAVLLPCRYGDIDYMLFLPLYNPLDEGIKRALNSVRM